MSALLSAMRDADANAELRYLHEGRRLIVGWGWSWLDWQVGLAAYLDPSEKPGAWLNLGPLTFGFYLESDR